MRALPIPQVDHKGLYEEVIEQTGYQEDYDLLTGLTDRVVDAGRSYDVAARRQELCTIEPLRLTTDEVSVLRPLYERRLVDKDGEGRWAYDYLRNSSRFCPFCSFGEVYEVDHFLSKDDFPELNVLPTNLTPICHPCNHIKLTLRPEAVDRYLLHPYYDRLPEERWLFARIDNVAGGPVLHFWVELDEARFGNLSRRLGYHFRTLELDRRFRERSAEILSEMEDDLDEFLEDLTAEGMAEYFRAEGGRKFRSHGNVLEAAAYFAAFDCPPFCAGELRS